MSTLGYNVIIKTIVLEMMIDRLRIDWEQGAVETFKK